MSVFSHPAWLLERHNLLRMAQIRVCQPLLYYITLFHDYVSLVLGWISTHDNSPMDCRQNVAVLASRWLQYLKASSNLAYDHKIETFHAADFINPSTVFRQHVEDIANRTPIFLLFFISLSNPLANDILLIASNLECALCSEIEHETRSPNTAEEGTWMPDPDC